MDTNEKENGGSVFSPFVEMLKAKFVSTDEMNDLKRKYAELEAKLAEQQAELEKSKGKLESQENVIVSKAKENESSRETISKLEQQILKHSNTISQLREEAQGTQQNLLELQEKVNDAEKQLDETVRENSKKHNWVTGLETMVSEKTELIKKLEGSVENGEKIKCDLEKKCEKFDEIFSSLNCAFDVISAITDEVKVSVSLRALTDPNWVRNCMEEAMNPESILELLPESVRNEYLRWKDNENRMPEELTKASRVMNAHLQRLVFNRRGFLNNAQSITRSSDMSDSERNGEVYSTPDGTSTQENGVHGSAKSIQDDNSLLSFSENVNYNQSLSLLSVVDVDDAPRQIAPEAVLTSQNVSSPTTDMEVSSPPTEAASRSDSPRKSNMSVPRNDVSVALTRLEQLHNSQNTSVALQTPTPKIKKKSRACGYCGKQFLSLSVVKSHLKSCRARSPGTTGNEETDNKTSRHNTSAPSKRLKSHDEHGDKKNNSLSNRKSLSQFKCTKCQSSFKYTWDLRKHMKDKHNYYVACPICGNSFKTRRGLTSHQRIKHQDLMKTGTDNSTTPGSSKEHALQNSSSNVESHVPTIISGGVKKPEGPGEKVSAKRLTQKCGTNSVRTDLKSKLLIPLKEPRIILTRLKEVPTKPTPILNPQRK